MATICVTDFVFDAFSRSFDAVSRSFGSVVASLAASLAVAVGMESLDGGKT